MPSDISRNDIQDSPDNVNRALSILTIWRVTHRMLEIVEEHIQREVEALEEQRQGAVMMTVGKVLLWMDLILVCFVYAGLRTGSHLFFWWVLGEGLLGLVLMGVGSLKKADAARKLAVLAPQIRGQYQPHA